MKVTKANIEQYVKNRGLEPIQIDGIPEGFSFKEPDIVIGLKKRKGQYIALVPLKEFEEIKCSFEGQLLDLYNQKNGK